MIILNANHSAGDLGSRYRVIQQVSPRVVIVEPTDEVTKEDVRNMNGIEAVIEPGESLAADRGGALTDTEELFVKAYAQRSPHKERPGEGLEWDAEGFLPPDPPPKR